MKNHSFTLAPACSLTMQLAGRVLVGEITNCSANAGGFFLPRSAEALASRLMFG